MKSIHEGNRDGQCGDCEVLKEVKMEDLIKRLRREREESQQQFFNQGRKDGLEFAKNAHYMAFQQALSWNPEDENFGDRLEETWGEVKVEGDDILPKLRAQMGVQEDESLDESLVFYDWARGFMESIAEFWLEVADQL